MTKFLTRLLLVIAIVFVLWMLKSFIVPLLFSGVLAVLIHPLIKFLERRFTFSKSLSALCGVIFICLLLLVVASLVGRQITIFVADFDQYSNNIAGLVQRAKLSAAELLNLDIDEYISQNFNLEQIIRQNVQNITTFVGGSFDFLGTAIMLPFYIFFFLYYRSFLIEFIHRLFSQVEKEKLDSIINKIYGVIHNYIRGVLEVMIIVGILNTIGLWLLGIKSAVFFGFFAAVLLIIPYVGVFIGSLLPTVMALVTKDSLWYPVGVIAIFAFIQFLEGNFITPRITGSRVSINPFVGILSLLLFGSLWGMGGVILAYPLTAILKVIFDNVEELKPFGFLIGEPEAEKSAGPIKVDQSIPENDQAIAEQAE
jgi:predicted PurR-regulated permease PerM